MDRDIIEDVRSWLNWPAGETERLEQLTESMTPSSVFAPPRGADARKLLARLNVPPHAIGEIVDGTPSAEGQPEAWWLLDRLYGRLTDRSSPELPPPWPAPTPGDDALTRYFHLYVFLAAVHDLRGFHARRTIPEDVMWSTLSDVGLQIANYECRHGRPGFDGAFWVWQHFRGVTYQLGRLQFNFWSVDFDPDDTELGDVRRGDPALAVHIPAHGPLTPGACDDSFAHARRFFPRHFPERPCRIGTCGSWLLDEQLVEYLPPTANILQFQRRFTAVPGWSLPGDDDVVRFVFGYIPATLGDLPQRTTLERAVVRHLREGRHWQIRLGWVEL